MRRFTVTMADKDAYGDTYDELDVLRELTGFSCSVECEGRSFADVAVHEDKTAAAG